MIIDISGTVLMPGNLGADCPGDGAHKDAWGEIIECCCDECDYMLCCLESHDSAECARCIDEDCPRSLGRAVKNEAKKGQ